MALDRYRQVVFCSSPLPNVLVDLVIDYFPHLEMRMCFHTAVLNPLWEPHCVRMITPMGTSHVPTEDCKGGLLLGWLNMCSACSNPGLFKVFLWSGIIQTYACKYHIHTIHSAWKHMEETGSASGVSCSDPSVDLVLRHSVYIP